MAQEKRMVEELLTAVSLMQAEQSQPTGSSMVLQEALDNVKAMLAREDRGWQLFRGGAATPEEGLTLDDLKAWSQKLREFAAASPLGKRGLNLRHGFIWRGGMRYAGIPGIDGTPRGETRGRGPKIAERMADPLNMRNFFGPQARRRREAQLYYDGIALWVGEDATGKIMPIPLSQISGVMTDPDFPGIIWAYRREWSRRQRDGKAKTMVRWYFVDHFKDQATETIQYGTKRETVETDWTAFDMHANSADGWPFGVPDALAAWIWADIAKNLYMDGVDVSEAMATIAFKVNSSNQQASNNAALQFAGQQGAASTAIMGVGSDLSVLSSAGRGYDFKTIREVIAMVATALDVSTIHLTSNAADAGSSYGSAQTLDEPQRLTMMTRRDEHVALDRRVLAWLGAKEEAEPYFEPYDDDSELYRKMQTVTLPWLQGVLGDTEYKALVADVLGLPSMGPVPEGIMLPNNEKSIQRKDVDTDGQEPTGSTGSPTQGRSTRDGDGNAPRDIRDDEA